MKTYDTSAGIEQSLEIATTMRDVSSLVSLTERQSEHVAAAGGAAGGVIGSRKPADRR